VIVFHWHDDLPPFYFLAMCIFILLLLDFIKYYYNVRCWYFVIDNLCKPRNNFIVFHNNFYPRNAMLARVLAVTVCLCVSACLSVCLSVTRRYCIKTAERRITQSMPCHSPGTVVFDAKSRWWETLSTEICTQSDSLFWKPRFQPISVHSASTVRAGEKKFN